MDEQDVVFKMAVRQSPQPLQPLRSNHFNCPANHGRGVVVEPFENFRVGAGPIVVADQGQPLMLGDFVQTSLRIATVAHDIAEAQRLVDRRAVAQNGFQGVPVGVNVREDRDLQAGLS